MKKLGIILFVTICLAHSNLLMARSLGGYIGGNIGFADHDTNITLGTASLDEEDMGWKIYGGVDINEYLSIEAQYADLGESTLNGNNGSTFTLDGTALQFTTTAELGAEVDSFGFSIVAGHKINEYIKPFVRFGVHSWELDINIAASGINGSVNADDDIDIFGGVGLQIKVSENFTGLVEFERYEVGGQVNSSLNLLSAGIQIRF